jgi:hypothetical protein
MLAVMSTTPTSEQSVREAVVARASAVRRLTLRANETGWSILDASGAVLFRRPGPRGRRECLEFARALGVLSIAT